MNPNGGLFTNPQQIRNDYLQQGLITPKQMMGQSLDDKIFAVGSNAGTMLGVGVGTLLGGKVPMQAEAEATQGAIQGLDWNDPQALLGTAQKLAQVNPQAAYQLYQAATKQQTDQLRLSDAQQKSADAERERARQAQVDAAVAALPEDATEEQIMKATFPLMTPQERATYAKGRQEETTKTTRQANASKLIDSQFPNLSPELKEFVLNDNALLNKMLDAAIRGPAERAKFQAGLPSEFDKKKKTGVTDGVSTNGRGMKAPSGYQWSANGQGLEPIPGGPADKDGAGGGGKAGESLQENIRQNESMLATANEAMNLINSGKPTGSGVGKLWDATGRFFGSSTEGGVGAQQLKVLAGRLTAAVPRFQGPQSDKDVQFYREMAGQVGDESLTLEERQAALQTVIDLTRKYDDLYKKQLNEVRGPNYPSQENASGGRRSPAKGGSTASGW